MGVPMKRRDFLSSMVAAAGVAGLRFRTSDAPSMPVRPFDLDRVRLHPGPFLDALEVNRRFLLAQDEDRLLHMFRITAGLPSTAEPLGGWEAPVNELRGHYVGHYLSALAKMSRSLADADLKARGDRIVTELAKCQQQLGNGYLSAFPEEFFDRLRDGKPVWAPFYTVHKIMAGLLDTHALTGNTQGHDELKGLHANTNIPKVVGAARRYELTGELRYRHIAEYFWRQVTTQRAYCTGGTSNGEGWNTEPGILSTELSGYTQEDCTTYNMLKLTRHIFGWTADPACADYCERALFNGILGSQHPHDGEKLYYVNLAAGLWKLFGTPGQDYWCCTGTMSEAFSQLGDSIYFHDDGGIYVNLFIASELNWTERGVRLVQETRFPEVEGTTLRIQTAKPVRFALRIRVPYWATNGGTAALNGRTLDGFAAPGGYYVLDRTWRNGDTVAIKLPMSLHLHPMPDDPTLAAVMYGPLVLAGRLGTEGLTPDVLRAEPTKPRTIPEYKGQPIAAPELRAQGTERVSQRSLEFRAVGPKGEVTLVPFHTIFDERYAIYWRLTT